MHSCFFVFVWCQNVSQCLWVGEKNNKYFLFLKFYGCDDCRDRFHICELHIFIRENDRCNLCASQRKLSTSRKSSALFSSRSFVFHRPRFEILYNIDSIYLHCLCHNLPGLDRWSAFVILTVIVTHRIAPWGRNAPLKWLVPSGAYTVIMPYHIVLHWMFNIIYWSYNNLHYNNFRIIISLCLFVKVMQKYCKSITASYISETVILLYN